jgi:PKD repeat protein
VGITSRSWTFGDGGTAGNVVGPSHTYAAGGTYTVTLTVTDGGGLSNSTTRSVTVTAPVNQPPVPSFTVSCNGLTCTFDSSGSTDDVSIVNREWQFGDGTRVLSVVTLSKTYANPGTYLVRLNVIDGGGLWTTATKQVTVP